MANDDKDDDLEQNHKVVLDYLNSCSKEELFKALFDMFQIEQILKDEKTILEDRIRHYAEGCEDLIKKNESLKAERLNFEETIKVLKEQNSSQMKKFIDLKNKNDDIESKLKTLKYEFEKSLQSLPKINDSEFKFIKMLTRQKGSNDKRGIGYNNATHNHKSKTTFVKTAYKHKHSPTCSFCCKEGHHKLCLYRRKDNYIIQNSVH